MHILLNAETYIVFTGPLWGTYRALMGPYKALWGRYKALYGPWEAL